ncbi:MAG: hypothetical protein FWG70_03715 [Oscillospiraceae bacterium]|nr:hypothetical protein [Oscillospiraceae bacterium]
MFSSLSSSLFFLASAPAPAIIALAAIIPANPADTPVAGFLLSGNSSEPLGTGASSISRSSLVNISKSKGTGASSIS